MARVMTLDGIDPGHLSTIRAQLSQPELSWLQRPIELRGLAPSSWPMWIWALVGIAGGAWFAARK